MRNASFPACSVLIPTLLLATAALAAQPSPAVSPAAPTPRTLRVDFHHTGGMGDEIFSLDRVVVEPLAWPGHPDGRIDESGGGAHRFLVYDGQGDVEGEGKLLYSYGFGSIFSEWVTTAEAASRHRTFHESLRFPTPDGPVTVVVESRGGNPADPQAFTEVWRTPIDPSDIFVDPTSPIRLEVVEVAVHGPAQDKVDVLFLGDGYTAEECASKFPADAERMAAALFAYDPFSSRQQDFNIWGLCPPSPESGVSRPSTGVHVASPVGTTYDAFGSERYLLTFENRAFRDIAALAPYEFVEILVNNETYGGGGIFNLYGTVSVDNDWAKYVFVHEFGHHFAGLADEYYTSPTAYTAPAATTEPWEPNVTALLDPTQLKWADLLSPGVPMPTPWPKDRFETHARVIQERRSQIRSEQRPESEMSALFAEQQAFETKLLSEAEHAHQIGAFQGANYDSQAYYRSQADCVMFTRNPVPFCTVCQHALGAVIDRYTP